METTEATLAANLAALSCSIYAADKAGRSTRYMNRLYRLYFAAEDALKAYNGQSGRVLA